MKTTLMIAALITTFFVGAKAQESLYGVTSDNAIFITSTTSSPTAISGPYTVSRVAIGQVLVGITEHPAGGVLYALGYDPAAKVSELYKIEGSGTSFRAIPVSGVLNNMDLGSADNVAMAFAKNNELRITDRNVNIYRMDMLTGSVTGTGTNGLSSTNNIQTGAGMTDAVAYTDQTYSLAAARQITNIYPAAVANDMQVYPNPTVNNAKIQLGKPATGNVDVQVVDLNGNIVKRFSYGQGNELLDIDLTNMPAGLYSLRVSGKDMAYHTLKIVKN
jgi:hypothetical protein